METISMPKSAPRISQIDFSNVDLFDNKLRNYPIFARILEHKLYLEKTKLYQRRKSQQKNKIK
jgi:hypothetical protein